MVQTAADLGQTLPSAGSDARAIVEAPATTRRVGWWQIFWRFMGHDKIGAAAFVVFAFFIFLALFGPYITSTGELTNLNHLYSHPSREHILGTDYAGHDIFTQIIRGTRSVLLVGA